MQIIVNVGDATPQDWEALAAFVAVKRGLLSSAGRIDGPSVIPPPAAVAALAKADDLKTQSAALVDDMVAAANERAAADQAAFEARTAAVVPPPPPAGVTVDSAGLPWDGRIHAESKSTNKDGTWRGKRGVDPALVASVTAELKAVMAIPAPPAASVDPLQAEAAAAFGSPAVPLPPATAVVPPPPPVPPVAPVAESLPTASPPAAVAETVAEEGPADPPFVVLMRKVTGRQTAGTLTPDAVAAALSNLGLPSIASLASRPDLIPAFEALLPA